MGVIGIDTSNYTTSVAFFDGTGGENCSKLLPVKSGELGLRQEGRGLRVVAGRAVLHRIDAVVREALAENPHPQLVRDYELDQSLVEKITAVARRVYGARGVELAPAAKKELARFTDLGYGSLPVVVAKTHLSITHEKGLDPASEWTLPIREARLAAGAGYVYALAGAMSTMPGLPSHPNAENVELVDGEIVGLF